MRVPALLLVLVSAALLASGCMGGPQDPDQRLSEACDRQREEVAEEEEGTPTAKSTDERLEETTLVECAGQETKVVDANPEDDDPVGVGDGDSEGDAPDGPDTDSGQAEAPAGGPPELTEISAETKSMFTESCGSCHALSDAGTSGTVGPGLDDTELDVAAITSQIENGAGSMPAGLLEGEDAVAVSEYVVAAAAAE